MGLVDCMNDTFLALVRCIGCLRDIQCAIHAFEVVSITTVALENEWLSTFIVSFIVFTSYVL